MTWQRTWWQRWSWQWMLPAARSSPSPPLSHSTDPSSPSCTHPQSKYPLRGKGKCRHFHLLHVLYFTLTLYNKQGNGSVNTSSLQMEASLGPHSRPLTHRREPRKMTTFAFPSFSIFTRQNSVVWSHGISQAGYHKTFRSWRGKRSKLIILFIFQTRTGYSSSYSILSNLYL